MRQIPAVNIDTCNACPHRDHSGAFTRGGPWPTCRGPGVVDWYAINETLNFHDPKANEKWSPPILPVNNSTSRTYTGEIPEWCPLPKVTP